MDFFPHSFVSKGISGERFSYAGGLNGCHTEVLFCPLVACPSWEGEASPRVLLNWSCMLAACQLLAKQVCSHLLPALSYTQQRNRCCGLSMLCDRNCPVAALSKKYDTQQTGTCAA